VCDLDGVVYLGDRAVPGAGPALREIEGRGYRLLFATNAPIRTPEAVAAHMTRLIDYSVAPSQVLTSAMTAAEVLSPRDAPVLVVGEGGLGLTLKRAGFPLTVRPEHARAVVVGLDRRLTYEHLRVAVQALLRGVRFVACNRDPTYPTESGLWPGGGAILAALETASGRTAEVVGKPYPAMRAAVLRRLGPGPTWLVGDRPETDLALGRGEGWITVLVLSGVVADPGTVPPELRPDLVLDSIADLPARLTD
jgi:HAD superfamily hydrolase (TIGR01450 family)